MAPRAEDPLEYSIVPEVVDTPSPVKQLTLTEARTSTPVPEVDELTASDSVGSFSSVLSSISSYVLDNACDFTNLSSKGVCAECQQHVLKGQARVKDYNEGKKCYYHSECDQIRKDTDLSSQRKERCLEELCMSIAKKNENAARNLVMKELRQSFRTVEQPKKKGFFKKSQPEQQEGFFKQRQAEQPKSKKGFFKKMGSMFNGCKKADRCVIV
jgi:hypothetical protein